MFGMEKKPKKKGALDDWEFDLEKQLENPTEFRKVKGQVEERVQKLKTVLREGGTKQAFDDAQTLLHGYLALQKVLQRFSKK